MTLSREEHRLLSQCGGGAAAIAVIAALTAPAFKEAWKRSEDPALQEASTVVSRAQEAVNTVRVHIGTDQIAAKYLTASPEFAAFVKAARELNVLADAVVGRAGITNYGSGQNPAQLHER